jgi:nucleotide-binding universal stress UspA family protein
VDIARYLARHGIQANVELAEAAGADTGAVILECAATVEADLIVMGAYGHSRFTELVLGGVTRTVLRRMTVPVLMAN